MSLSAQFETNPEKETNGVAFEFSPNPDGTVPTITLSRMGRMNKAYAKALDKATRQYRRQDGELKIDPVMAERLFQKVFVQVIMKTWANIQLPKLDDEGKRVTEDGKTVMTTLGELNEENANILFERLPYFYEDLQALAKNGSNYQDDAIEEEAKN